MGITRPVGQLFTSPFNETSKFRSTKSHACLFGRSRTFRLLADRKTNIHYSTGISKRFTRHFALWQHYFIERSNPIPSCTADRIIRSRRALAGSLQLVRRLKKPAPVCSIGDRTLFACKLTVPAGRPSTICKFSHNEWIFSAQIYASFIQLQISERK